MNQACAAASLQNIGLMWKTVSEDCNLACTYCYYSTCGGKPKGKSNRIAPELLEKVIREYLEICRGVATFSWQGGEPLLAGIDFFEDVVRLQKKFSRPSTKILNTLQTNGTLITDQYAEFFRKNEFLLGISVDGPQAIHDARRVDWRGQGSFDRIMGRIRLLEKHGVEFNILSVIHKDNVRRAGELFDFYEREKLHYVQFIPCMLFQSQRVDQAGEYEITAQAFGDFLCEAFDRWYNNGNPIISVRFFDNLLSMYCHRDAELCSHRKVCGKVLVLEPNGDAFPCDFYINQAWKIGNAGSEHLRDMLDSDIYTNFEKMKPAIAESCRQCEWLHLCHGGCPRNRRWFDDGNGCGPDYFCQSYRHIYAYAHERLHKLSLLVRRNLFAQGVQTRYKGKLPGRNDWCACGSGRKYKSCCLTNN